MWTAPQSPPRLQPVSSALAAAELLSGTLLPSDSCVGVRVTVSVSSPAHSGAFTRAVVQPQSSPRMCSPPRVFSRASACDHRRALLSIDSPLLGCILNVHLGTAQLRVGLREQRHLAGAVPGRSCARLACPLWCPVCRGQAVCRGGSHARGLAPAPLCTLCCGSSLAMLLELVARQCP